MNDNLVDLIIDQTKNDLSLKEISNQIFNYFSETNVNIILNNLETLIDFLNQYKKNLVVSIIYNDELSNIIENIEEFYIYLKNIYTNQEYDLKQNLYTNTQESKKSEDLLNEQLNFYNFLFETDEVDIEDDENENSEQINISPDDFTENIEEDSEINENNNQNNNNVYYELTIIDLLKYNFNLLYIKQFLKDIIELIKIISNLENQTLDELKF